MTAEDKIKEIMIQHPNGITRNLFERELNKKGLIYTSRVLSNAKDKGLIYWDIKEQLWKVKNNVSSKT